MGRDYRAVMRTIITIGRRTMAGPEVMKGGYILGRCYTSV
nr:MAG TPA: hypothetical protein [Caudoviricetes sp.]